MTWKESINWGQTQFQMNSDLEIGRLAAEYDPELGQLVNSFQGHVDPGVFRLNDCS